MTVSAARLPADRGPGLALGVVGLGLFGVVCGVGVAAGELEAVVAIVIAGFIGSRHVDEVFPYFYEVEVIHFTDALGYLRDVLLKPMLTVVAALIIAQAVMKSKKVENFLVPFIVAVWVMSVMA